MNAARVVLPDRFACMLACALGAAALAGAPAMAAATDPAPQTVNVTGLKDPEMRSYRAVWAGMDAFDENRALAPGAILRFRIVHADGNALEPEDALALRLASDGISAPVPIDAHGVLTIGRDQAAYDADATFILNRKSGLFAAHAEVRTPGLGADRRRLGDLRLECRVRVAIVRQEMPFLARAALNALTMTTDWCGKDKLNYSYVDERPVSKALLRAGERTLALQVEDGRYLVPIGERAWPDDALIELTLAGAP